MELGTFISPWTLQREYLVKYSFRIAAHRLYFPVVLPISIQRREPLQLDAAPKDLRFGRGRLLERFGQVVKAVVTADERKETVAYDVWFLFQGTDPIELTLSAESDHRVSITPQEGDAMSLQPLFERWWRAFRDVNDEQVVDRSYLPVAASYLLSTLSQRFDLPSI